MPHGTVLIRWLVDPARQEELLGDLEELRGHRGRLRAWYDVASVCVRQSRLRAWRPARFAVAAMLLGAAAALTPRSGHRAVRATDAAGSFTLEFDGPSVVAATLGGSPVPAERLVQSGGRLVIRGGAGTRDLIIRLRPDGSFYWRGRDSQAASRP